MNLPALRPSLPVPRPRVPAILGRVLPAVRGSIALVAASLAAEFAARAIMQRVMSALSTAARPASPVVDTAGRVTRTIVTEVVVKERFRRPR